MAGERQVLVKLVHIEGFYVADDVCAELRNVNIAEVDVLSTAVEQTSSFML